MDEIYTFSKSKDERFSEFKQVLWNDEERIVTASQIRKEWSYFLELTIDQCGWRALWKIPRERCDELKIQFPNVVIAFVTSSDFENLTATVQVIAVHGDIHLSEYLEAHLIDLYPTKQQDESIGLNMKVTAENLDMAQFFYHNVWMPWDLDDDDVTNWPSKHLKTRLDLYYDLLLGVIPRESAVQLKSIINEAKTLLARCLTIEEDLSDSDDVEVTNPNKIRDLTKMHFRLNQIKSEFEIIENPELRRILLDTKDAIPEETASPKWLVITGGRIVDTIEYLERCKVYVEAAEEPNMSSKLDGALKAAKVNDTVLLGKGTYQASSIGGLEGGGRIIGMFEPTDTIIKPTENVIVLFELFAPNILINNIKFLVNTVTCTLAVRHGVVTINNCIFEGEGLSFTRQGIIIFSGAQLILKNCTFRGFNSAIVCKTNASVKITNCEIAESNTGLMFYDKSDVDIRDSTIENCTEYGICLESTQFPSSGIDIERLKKIGGVSCQSLLLKNNRKHDLAIIRKPMLILELQETPAPYRKTLQRCELTDTPPEINCHEDVDMEGIIPME